MHAQSTRKFWPATLVAAGVLVAIAAIFYLVQPAYATVTLTVPSSLPGTVTVGDTAVPTTLEFENASTGDEGDGLPTPADDILTVDSIFATLSCTGTGSPCTVPDVGVIVPNTVAGPNNDAVGVAGTACAGISFEIVPTGTAGVYQFIPSGTITLTIPDATAQSGSDYCRADYTSSVLKFPTVDTNGASAGVQTRYRSTVNVTHPNAGSADSTGSDPVLVNATPSVVTEIHNSAHSPVLAVAVGTPVHDSAVVSAPAGSGGPTPTGNVIFRWFDIGDICGDDPPTATSDPFALAGGTVDGTTFVQTPTVSGSYAFQGAYQGSADGTYSSAVSPCEPLNVVNAKIALSPPTDTNEVGDDHVITCTIQVNPGTGWVNATDGTVCDAAIDSGPGSFSGGDTCVVDGGDGNCTVTITSDVSGTTTVSACTSGLVVATVALTRCTDGAVVEPGHSNGSPVTKVWVNAKISLTPATDTNEVGDDHVITCTIEVNDGGGFDPAPDGTVCDAAIDSGPGSFSGGDTCAVDGGDGNCTVTITSDVSGTTTVSACTSGLTVGGVALTRCTDGQEVETGHSNGDPVTKDWVNAKISLTPATDTNEVGDDHVITCTIEVNDGSGWANAPDGTVCDAAIDSGPGSFSGGDTCAVDGGDGNCTVTITSAVSGTTTVSACTSGLSVGGVALTRCTDGQEVETGHSNGDPVTKDWVNAKISLSPPNAVNPVGTNHVITCTIQVNPGTGFVNAPDGTICDAAIDSGPGSFVGSDTCAVDGGDGNCTVTITSAVAGTTTVSACTSGLSVGGVAITRCTDGQEVETGHSNGPPVTKTWEEGGGEGCTPGYWKQPHHFDSWVGYSPNQQFSTVFENAFPGMTLLQVLSQGGGGLNALGRHTVAALLNASSGDVEFEFTTAEVIAAFNAVFPGGDYEGQKNIFAAENERGCPLN